MHAHVRAVHTDLVGAFGEFDGLAQHVASGARDRAGHICVVPEGEEAESLHVICKRM